MPALAMKIAVRTVAAVALSLVAARGQEKTAEPAKAISLTEAQKRAMQGLVADSAVKTAAMLQKLAEKTKAFNTNLLSERPDPELDQKLGREISGMFAEVIGLRLSRIRRSVEVLTPEQKAALTSELKKTETLLLFDDAVKKVLGDPAK